MNKNKLEEFVSALNALSDDVKDWDVNMSSGRKPMCDTPGCHAGLISIVAQDLPELQEIYKNLHLLECAPASGSENQYIFYVWGRALAIFLGFKCGNELEIWARKNPELWGNKYGYYMFCAFLAFAEDLSKEITHRDIIEHWKKVLVNLDTMTEYDYEQE